MRTIEDLQQKVFEYTEAMNNKISMEYKISEGYSFDFEAMLE